MRRKILRALMVALPAWAAAFGAPVRFQATPAEEAGSGEAAVLLRLLPQSTDGIPRTVTLPVPGEVLVDLPEETTWQILSESRTLWSAPQWVAPGPGGDEKLVRLRLHPAATVTGALEVPAQEPLPSRIDLRLESSPDARSPKIPLIPVDCPVEEKRFVCRVPAGRLDLRLRAANRIPAYLWDLVVQAGEVKDVGVLPLKAGASVTGWVRHEDGSAASGVRVRLEAETLGLPSEPGKLESLRAMALETRTNVRGFFQIEQATPGTFVVKADQEGLVPANRSGIEIRPDLEARILDPLVLAKPLGVKVSVSPARAPSGGLWKLVLEKKSAVEGLKSEVHRGEADPNGIWAVTGLQAGKYSLFAQDEDMRWSFEDLDVSADKADLQIEIPGVLVKGRVRIGEEPLRATLWFGGRSAARRARFDSDEEGRFEGLLPEEGTWPVELVAEREGLRVKLDPVEVRKLPGTRQARVELQIPDTRLQGRVVDEQGRPVGRAFLLLQPLRKLPSTAESDAEGAFEVRGLPPGPLFVHAEDGERESEWLQAHLKEDEDTPSLQLVVRTRMTVQGRVFSDRGPVAGARVEAMGELSEAGAGSGDQTVTGPAGEFTLKLPAGTRMMTLSVLAPGNATRMMLVPLGTEPVLEIPVEPVGGTLVFDFGARTVQEFMASRAGILAHGGAFVPFGVTRRWVQMGRIPQPDPHRLVLPNMEAGEYILCFGAAQEAVARGQEPPPGQCTGGSLAPLQELTLGIPEL